MSSVVQVIAKEKPKSRQAFIVRSFTDNYEHLIAADPGAWRGKFRKMAETAVAFYRGSAALFYADVSRDADPFANAQTSRVWIQGDLHAENFGTYMNGAGQLVFDVNDFDEAYVGPFTWDVKRFAAGLALIGYQKALSDPEIRDLVAHAAQNYTQQVARFARDEDKDFSLRLDTAQGAVLRILQRARLLTRSTLLDFDTEIRDADRKFKQNKYCSPLDEVAEAKLTAALEAYYQTIPARKKRTRIHYLAKDFTRRKGLGIGSAGLEMYTVLLEGDSQALENDILLSLKVAQPSAVAKYITDPAIRSYFEHDGHRTAVSQRALQAYADPLLGYTSVDGKGIFAAEVSPYCADMDWSQINDFDEMMDVTASLARCVAKIHCISDEDSDHTLVNFSTEQAINGVMDGRESDFVAHIADFGVAYAAIMRHDHQLFTDAFRNREIPGL
ncbi:MAG: DUF2252 domain-containing protein [Saprospiraceae bacterium]|nr:DUF2252 domain-containing protein [Saprospiraceae bacterium]